MKTTVKVLIIVYAITLITLLILFFKMYLFELIIVASAIAYFVYKSKRKIDSITFKNDSICREVAILIFNAVSEVGNVIEKFVHIPQIVEDLYDALEYRGVYNKAVILKLRLYKTLSEVSHDDLEYIKNVLQAAVNARISGGYLNGFSWAVAVSGFPLIKIATLECSKIYVNIGILLTNTRESANAAYLSDKSKQPSDNDFNDPLF